METMQAINFNKTGSLTYNQSVIAFGSSFTIDVWLKLNSFTQTNHATLFMRGNATTANGVQIYDNKLGFRINTTNNLGTELEPISNLELDKWYRLTFVYASKSMNYYRDGVLIKTFSTSADFPTTDNISFGDWKGDYGTPIDGTIHDFKFYNRNLNDAELTRLFKNTTYNNLFGDSLVLQLKFNDKNSFEGMALYGSVTEDIFTEYYFIKTLISHDSEYKKWIPAIEEIPPSSTIPNMTAMVDKGFTIFSNDTAPRQPIHNLFSDSLGYFESGMSNTTVDKFIVGFLSDTPYLITKYEMKAHTTSMKTHFGNWILQGSNDTTTGFDGTWVDLDSQNGITWVANETKTFSINTPNSYKSYRLSEVNSPYGGYPMMYHLKFFKAGEPKKEGYWLNVSTTLPTKQHFLSDGMDSLSPLLDRRVETLEPLPMTDKSEILSSGEVGKVFTRKIDLQKYIDLRKIEVEVR